MLGIGELTCDCETYPKICGIFVAMHEIFKGNSAVCNKIIRRNCSIMEHSDAQATTFKYIKNSAIRQCQRYDWTASLTRAYLETLCTSCVKDSFHTGSKVLGLVVDLSRWCSSASMETYGSIGWSSATYRVFTNNTNTHFGKHSTPILCAKFIRTTPTLIRMRLYA